MEDDEPKNPSALVSHLAIVGVRDVDGAEETLGAALVVGEDVTEGAALVVGATDTDGAEETLGAALVVGV